MKVADLSEAELARQLGEAALRLRTGPFVTRIGSRLAAVAEGIATQYADYRIEDEQAFVDFVISVDRPSGLRRWIRPQVLFSFDGETPFTPLPGEQGFPMFEWGMNWCVSSKCHQYLTLHSAVLERNGRALLLPAPSGSGKSTLCAALAFRGWRLLSDELALIEPASCRIVPLPRPVSLKNASIDVIRAFAPEARFSAVCHDTVKGSVAHCRAPGDAVPRAAELAAPGWIVLPRYEAGAQTQLRPLPKAQAVMKLIDCAFNFNIHRHAGFDLLCRLVDQSECCEFVYSQLDEAVALFARMADAIPPSA